MSEFERRSLDAKHCSSPLTHRLSDVPDDFSDEDMEFARELDALFSVDNEDLPPFFAQTLLASEDPRFQAVEHGFEQKTHAHVFRRLKLRRHLFKTHVSPVLTLTGALPARRTLLSIFVACMLIMTITVASTANAFTSGVTFLLSGAHSGVLFLNGYPRGLAATSHSRSTPVPSAMQSVGRQMNLWDVARYLHFPIYFPGTSTLPLNYQPSRIFLDDSAQTQGWIDGPVMEMEYAYNSPGVGPSGSGTIAIAEFKPFGRVMEAVQQSSAYRLEISANGAHSSAIYVNGHWGCIGNSSSYQWVYDQSSQLIYERDGVVFWIVGDQRDGIDGHILLNIASSLTPFSADEAYHLSGRIFEKILQDGDPASPFADTVVYVVNADTAEGPTLQVVGDGNLDNSPDSVHFMGSVPHDDIHNG
jgi:hypothetical protein